MPRTNTVNTPTPTRPYIIEDWAGNRYFPAETFAAFEDARDRIMQHANMTATGDTEEDREADFDSICEDLYAIRY